MHRRHIDRVGQGLLAAGGCLTLVVTPLVIVAVVLFAAMFAIGLSEHPDTVASEAFGVVLGMVAVVVVVTIATLVVWVLALRGHALAQVIVVVGGAFLASVSNPYPERLGADYQRPEDIEFTMAKLAIALLPAGMALGAALRLLAHRPRRPPEASRAGPPPGPLQEPPPELPG